ncbi:MAG: Serine-tRNA ligase [Candidatus Collierbacteria bacterium GW2011_GWC2_43_12]|uniref:Serine-tRNA ligase n=1 Tax=Candidatus Collierbacteria bacterium GW2011_GWC2_43_12 TaxID=1618390 RepID=A0A0G1D140_9BACT|nr:MAG: Serine-tRNA ligase [Candidatus Collierbacteria bacterium GW2011_GWC2_43_12]
MLDINYIRDNQESLKAAISNKQFDPAMVDKLIKIDDERRGLIKEVENLRHLANENIADLKGKPSEEQISTGREIKQKLQEVEPRLAETEKQFTELMYHPGG